MPRLLRPLTPLCCTEEQRYWFKLRDTLFELLHLGQIDQDTVAEKLQITQDQLRELVRTQYNLDDTTPTESD